MANFCHINKIFIALKYTHNNMFSGRGGRGGGRGGRGEFCCHRYKFNLIFHSVKIIKIVIIILKLNNVVMPYSNVSKRCRRNGRQCTINSLNIRTPKKLVVITLKFELQCR